jgi:hypothetical protein
MQNNSWARLLAYVTGLVNQRLLLQCEYLIAENRILRSHVSGRLRLSDAERSTLAEIGKRLGRKCLAEVACIAKPETILAWYPCGQTIKRLGSRTLTSRRVGRDSERSCSWDLAVRLTKGRGEGCPYPGGFVQNDDVRCIRATPGVTKLLQQE